jgi:hypothetical protein
MQVKAGITDGVLTQINRLGGLVESVVEWCLWRDRSRKLPAGTPALLERAAPLSHAH